MGMQGLEDRLGLGPSPHPCCPQCCNPRHGVLPGGLAGERERKTAAGNAPGLLALSQLVGGGLGPAMLGPCLGPADAPISEATGQFGVNPRGRETSFRAMLGCRCHSAVDSLGR